MTFNQWALGGDWTSKPPEYEKKTTGPGTSYKPNTPPACTHRNGFEEMASGRRFCVDCGASKPHPQQGMRYYPYPDH